MPIMVLQKKKSTLYPLEGSFYDGQIFNAQNFRGRKVSSSGHHIAY